MSSGLTGVKMLRALLLFCPTYSKASLGNVNVVEQVHTFILSGVDSGPYQQSKKEPFGFVKIVIS